MDFCRSEKLEIINLGKILLTFLKKLYKECKQISDLA